MNENKITNFLNKAAEFFEKTAQKIEVTKQAADFNPETLKERLREIYKILAAEPKECPNGEVDHPRQKSVTSNNINEVLDPILAVMHEKKPGDFLVWSSEGKFQISGGDGYSKDTIARHIEEHTKEYFTQEGFFATTRGVLGSNGYYFILVVSKLF